jgi:hypothetical protein
MPGLRTVPFIVNICSLTSVMESGVDVSIPKGFAFMFVLFVVEFQCSHSFISHCIQLAVSCLVWHSRTAAGALLSL